MASDLECLQMEEKKFFPTDDKKVERSFLRRSVLKLKKRAEFISIRKNGRFQKSKFFIVNYQYMENSENFLGITVSKKLGKAVIRNYLTGSLKEYTKKKLNKSRLFDLIEKGFREKYLNVLNR